MLAENKENTIPLKAKKTKKKKGLRADERFEIKRVIPGMIDANGKKVRKSFYSYVSVADCEKQFENYLISINSAANVINSNMPLGEWALKWLDIYKKGKVKESTYKSSYERPVVSHIIPGLGNKMLSSIRGIDINAFMTEIAKKYSASTVSKVKNCLYDMFERAVENDLCIKNPCKNITVKSSRVPEDKRTYPEDVVNSILDFATTAEDGIYIKILLILGLRCSELCGLKYADFDFDANVVHIQRAATDLNGSVVVDVPKSKGSLRTLPISDSFARELRDRLPQSRSGYILPAQRSASCPLNPKNFIVRYNRFFRRYADYIDAANFDALSPHELRHTCGTLLYKKTGDIYAVSKYMGHSAIAVTAKYYVHSDAEVLRKLAVIGN